ncbi:MAG: hypothetical protein PWQ65_45 [Bacteroidota bacterium]|nr:hypothetical protein [Bacteroidota bacterium]
MTKVPTLVYTFRTKLTCLVEIYVALSIKKQVKTFVGRNVMIDKIAMLLFLFLTQFPKNDRGGVLLPNDYALAQQRVH